jgi:hypothetical protein
MNSIGAYALLTLPHSLFSFTDGKYGFPYPTWVLLLCSITSLILSNFITKWEIRKSLKKSDNFEIKYYQKKK